MSCLQYDQRTEDGLRDYLSDRLGKPLREADCQRILEEVDFLRERSLRAMDLEGKVNTYRRAINEAQSELRLSKPKDWSRVIDKVLSRFRAVLTGEVD